MKYFKHFSYTLILLIIIGCSNEDSNSLPQITSANLEINENAILNASVGVIQATDSDGDTIQFSLIPEDSTLSESELDFRINSNTGEVKVSIPENIDFETAEVRDIIVSMSDGKGSIEQVVPIQIINEEDGLLTNYEKDLVDYTIYLSLGQHPSSFTITTPRKKTYDINLYVFGSKVDSDFLNQIDRIINELNPLIASQDIEISYVNSLEDANLAFFYGEPSEIQDLWPDMYEDMTTVLSNGRAYSSGHPNRIYIQPNISLNRRYNTSLHEFLHILGLGHSYDCEGSNLGVVSSGNSSCYQDDQVPSSFYPKDQDVIDYLYSPTIFNSNNEATLRNKLTEIFENN